MVSKMVDNVVSTRVYAHEQQEDGEHIKVEVTVGMSLVRIRTYVHHVYCKEKSLMTWTLDTEQESDLDGNCGFWLVQQDPDDPSWSVVNYSIAVVLKSFLKQSGLGEAHCRANVQLRQYNIICDI